MSVAVWTSLFLTGLDWYANQSEYEAQQAQFEMEAYNSQTNAALATLNAEAVMAVAEYNAEYTLASSEIEAQMTLLEGAYSQELANVNAGIAAQNAINSREAAAYKAGLVREELGRILGSQRAAYGASGVNLSGTARDVQYDSALRGEKDALAVEHTGALEAAAYSYQAALSAWQGEVSMAMAQTQAEVTLWAGQAEAQGMLLSAGYQADAYALQAEGYNANAVAYGEMADAASDSYVLTQGADVIRNASTAFASVYRKSA